jgi:hypothetical protein
MTFIDPELLGAIFGVVDALGGEEGKSGGEWDFRAAIVLLGCVGVIGLGIWLTVMINFGFAPVVMPPITRIIGPTVTLSMSIILWIVIRATIRDSR